MTNSFEKNKCRIANNMQNILDYSLVLPNTYYLIIKSYLLTAPAMFHMVYLNPPPIPLLLEFLKAMPCTLIFIVYSLPIPGPPHSQIIRQFCQGLMV